MFLRPKRGKKIGGKRECVVHRRKRTSQGGEISRKGRTSVKQKGERGKPGELASAGASQIAKEEKRMGNGSFTYRRKGKGVRETGHLDHRKKSRGAKRTESPRGQPALMPLSRKDAKVKIGKGRLARGPRRCR